jgi:multimeric flavodoxin WrbA
MSKVLILYYSAYGHIEKMAEAVAEGARAVPGTEVMVKRVPELVPEEIAKKSGMKLDQPAPIATVDELADYDAIMDEITGGSPYGASTLAKGDGSRHPSANELDGARYQGKHVAQVTAKLARNQ